MTHAFGIRRTPWREAFSPARASGNPGWTLASADGARLAERVEMMTTPLARMRGLLGRSALEQGEAVVLVPCSQVHTVGMRFPIDAVFCDGDLTVLAAETLPPGRVSRTHRRACCCIELPAGTAATAGLAPGTRLRFVPSPTA